MKYYIFLAVTLALSLVPSLEARALTFNIESKNGNPVQDAVIVLKAINVSDTLNNSGKTPNVKISQRNYMFQPRLAVVEKGQRVSFPNFDKTHHSVYSFSETHNFEFPLYYGQSPEIIFDQEGIVVIGCNIHDWMLAYLLVVDTPYYGITGENGQAQIDAIPAGEYRLSYWHPGLDPQQGLKDIKTLSIHADHPVISLKLQSGAAYKWPRKPVYIYDKN